MIRRRLLKVKPAASSGGEHLDQTIGENLINSETNKGSTGLNSSTGQESSGSFADIFNTTTDYIEVDPSYTYAYRCNSGFFGGSSGNIVFTYDKDKNFIECFNESRGSEHTRKFDANVRYVRLVTGSTSNFYFKRTE